MYFTDLAHVHDTGFARFAAGVAPEVVRLLRAAGIRRGRVVEIGCGSGIVAERLANAGYGVLGIDISPAMIRLARARAPKARFRVASLTDAAIPRCDAVVSLGEVVTYAPGGLPGLRRFFLRVSRALVPGGMFVFDFIESPRGRTYARKTLRGRDWTLTVSATFDARRRVLVRRMDVARAIGRRTRRSRETHRVRVYDRDAIVSALERSGFRVKTSRAIGRHRLLPSNVAVVARRI